MRINLAKAAWIPAAALFLGLQAGCGELAKPPLPSLENTAFSRPIAGTALAAPSPSQLMAGLSRKDITPAAGTPLSGYGRRKGRPSEGIHDRLHVRVLALKNRTETLIFASCDLVAVNQALYEAVLKRISAQIPLAPTAFFLSATHTHSGSGAIGKSFLERIISGRYQEKVFESTANRIAEAVLEAAGSMKPAEIGYGSARLEGLIENRMIENGPVDDGLAVIKVRFEDGKSGFLVNLAAHPTVLSAKNFLFSADFPGALQKAVEEQFPGSVCVFTNGAAGDQRIRGFTGPENFARAEAIGKHLAEITVKTAESISPAPQAEISAVQTAIRLPPVKIRYGFFRLPSLIGNRLIGRDAVCNAARVNDMIFISIPGEMTSGLGLEIKREALRLGLKPLILGYTNGYIGYILPEADYETKSYESSVTFFGPTLDRYFLSAAMTQMHFLKEEDYDEAAA